MVFLGLDLVLAVHPLLRGCWDLWAQTAVHLGWTLALVPFLLPWALRRKPLNCEAAGRLMAGPAILPCLFAAAGFVSAWLSPFTHSAWPGFLNDVRALPFFYAPLLCGASGRLHIRRSLEASAILVLAAAFASASFPRWEPPLINPNVRAAFFLLLWPLFLTEIQEAKSPWAHRLWLVFTAGLLAGILQTRSFLGYVVFTGQAAAMAFFLKPRGYAKTFLTALGLAALIAGTWLFAGDWRRFLSLGIDQDRLSWWSSAFSIWKSHPVWGAGPGAFGEAYPGFRADPWGQNSLYAHSAALELLAERGAAGAVIFLVFLVWVSRSAWAKNRADKEPSLLQWGGIAGFVLYNLAHIGFSFPSPAWAFWALAGLICADMIPAQAKPDRRRHILGAAGSSVFALAWVAAGLFTARLFRADQHLAQARAALEQWDFEAVRSHVDPGLVLDPGHPELYSLRAEAMRSEENWTGAYEDARKAISLSPFSARFQTQAGDISLEQGFAEASLVHYANASKYLPLNPYIWLRQGEILEQENRKDEAVKSYRTALWLVEEKNMGSPAQRDDLIQSLKERLKDLGFTSDNADPR